MSKIPEGVAFVHPLSHRLVEGEQTWFNAQAIASNLVNCAFLDESATLPERRQAKNIVRELCWFWGVPLWQYWRLAFLARWRRSKGACLQLASYTAAGWDDLGELSEVLKRIEEEIEAWD